MNQGFPTFKNYMNRYFFFLIVYTVNGSRKKLLMTIVKLMLVILNEWSIVNFFVPIVFFFSFLFVE
jgi:hypothetical protein